MHYLPELGQLSHYEAAGSRWPSKPSWLMSWVAGSWKVQLPSTPEPLWRKEAGRHAQCDTSGGRMSFSSRS